MLILTRRIGEVITIGDKVRVKVVGISGRQVRLGIQAPDRVVVLREEIFLKIGTTRRILRTLMRGISGIMTFFGKMFRSDTSKKQG